MSNSKPSSITSAVPPETAGGAIPVSVGALRERLAKLERIDPERGVEEMCHRSWKRLAREAVTKAIDMNDAYENMRDYAVSKGLDVTCYHYAADQRSKP